MRIGINTNRMEQNGYGRFGDQMYEKLREYGFSCTDFSMSVTSSEIYKMTCNEAEKYLLEEKKLAEDAGIEIWQVHGPWRWPPRDATPEDRAERLEKMKRSIYMTSVLGVKYWIVHPIMPFGIHDKVSGEGDETRRLNMEFMPKLLECAKENGVVICLENMPMPEFSIGTPEEIASIVDEINDESFKICLDVGHVGVYENLKVADEVRKLGSKIRALHVHDSKIGIDAHLMPRQGVTDWEDFASALRETGFDGVFSLETKPPLSLPTPIFEKMSSLYFEVADDIINR